MAALIVRQMLDLLAKFLVLVPFDILPFAFDQLASKYKLRAICVSAMQDMYVLITKPVSSL